MFDLANAPIDLREADDLAPLKPREPNQEPAVLELQVGRFESQIDGPPGDCMTREVTFAEYKLHQWLAEHGAEEGERVLLMWSSHHHDHA
jgi:hypothetical protein